MRLHTVVIALTVWILLVIQQSDAADAGAIVPTGNWNAPASWSTGVVPGVSDNVYIGSSYPAGSVSSSTISLTQNQSASQVFLGYGNGTSGTLNLGNFDLTATNFIIGANGTGVGAINRGAGKLTIGTTLGVSRSTFAFGANDTSRTLELNSGTASTVAAGNISGGVNIFNGSALTINNALSLSTYVEVSNSTLNAQGNNIAANRIYLYDANALITNRGNFTAVQLIVNGQTLNLRTTDAVNDFTLTNGATTFASGAALTGQLNMNGSTGQVQTSSIRSALLSTASILTVKSGQPTGLTVAGVFNTDITINDTSKLRLELDGNIQGWVLRWANPGAGNHVADLNALITANKIDFTVTNGGQFSVVNNADGFTYIYQPVPEPATTLLVAVGGLASAWAVRRRRLATV